MSAKFMGEYNHTIDAKGRLIIPSKYREQLGEAFVITKGDDGCLYIYTKETWEIFLEKILNFPNNKNARRYRREFVSAAEEVEMDKQGRVLIPALLREHAGLEKDVVLAGVIDKIEIWDKTRWEESLEGDDMDEISEDLAMY